MNEAINYPRYSINDFAPGQEHHETLECGRESLDAFMDLTGDRHPLHETRAFAEFRGFQDRVCHGLMISAFLSGFIARNYLGSEGLLVSFSATYDKPVYCNIPLDIKGVVESVSKAAALVSVKWEVCDQTGVIFHRGRAGCLHSGFKGK